MTSTVSSAEPLVQGAFFKPCELSAPFNWQPGLLRKLDELRCMGQFCDVTIQVDDTIGDASFLPYMRVHSVIVAAGSPMLHEKLQDPSFAGSVLVAGVGVWQWEQVINFLYTGKVCLTASGQAEALVQAAIELKMEVLVNMLQDHLGPSDAAAVEDVKPLKSRQAADTSEPMDDDDEDNDAEYDGEDDDDDAPADAQCLPPVVDTNVRQGKLLLGKKNSTIIICVKCNKNMLLEKFEYHPCNVKEDRPTIDVYQEYRSQNVCTDGEEIEIPLPEQKCLICEESFPKRRSLTEHIKKEHGADKLKEVMPVKIMDQRVKCPKCNSVKRRQALIEHLWTVHGLREKKRPGPSYSRSIYYKCNVCAFRTMDPAVLHKHTTNVHGGLRAHMCEKCGKCLATQNGLQEHIRTHTDERPYACTHCSKSFRKKAALDSHVVLHTGYKPYTCNLCGKQFVQINSISLHFRNHHPTLPKEEWIKNRTYIPLREATASTALDLRK